jgi:hypothetical protein
MYVFYVFSMLALGVVIAPRHVVDRDQASVAPVPRPALAAAADISNILVGMPHVVTADLAFRPALDEDAASAGPVAPTVAGQPVVTARTGTSRSHRVSYSLLQRTNVKGVRSVG